MRLLGESEVADRWSRELGMPFHGAVIEANGHCIDLVFSDLSITPTVQPGYAPFIVAPA